MPPIGKLLDYSQARPPLAKVKAAGYSCVYRYVCSDASEDGLPGKRLTPAERDQILDAGLDIGIHGEDNNGAAQAGYARGRAQGQQWAAYAHDVLEAPKGMTIVAAVDYDTLGAFPAVVVDYLGGITDGLQGEYVTGVYGSIYVVDGALAAGDAVHGVQTNAWSHGDVSARAHVYQHGGSEFPNTDYNDILRAPHGTWLQTQGDDVGNVDTISDHALDQIEQLIDGRIKAHLGASAVTTASSALNAGISVRLGMDRRRDLAAVTTDPKELAAELLPLLLAAIPTGAPVTQATLEAALRSVFGSLDDPAGP